jgi:hypothetical protein
MFIFLGKVISFKYRGGRTCHIEKLMHSKMPFEQGKLNAMTYKVH